MKNIFLIICSLLPCISMAQDLSSALAEYRKEQAQEMTKDAFGPLKKDQIAYLSYYDAAPAYVIEAHVEQLFNEPTFQMPTYDGTSNPYKRYAILTFNLEGKSYALTAYQSVSLFQNEAYKNHLFLPFMDLTNGEETYEAGRYIDLSIADIKNGKITIDFNRAYNPYCAYSNGYRCPQPPRENILNLAIPAGEKKYKGPKNERTVNTNNAKGFTAQEQEIINSGTEDQILHVYQITDAKELAVLRTPATDIKYNEPLLDKLAARMLKTVNDPAHEGVGIAGPQVGISKNLIWVQRLDKTGEPFEFYVNPKIIWRSKLIRQGAEGCLSIPDVREDVKRSYAIKLQHVDKTGKVQEELIEGFTAVIFQHEVDHLYGILFPDRIEESSKVEYEHLTEKPSFFIKKGSPRP